MDKIDDPPSDQFTRCVPQHALNGWTRIASNSGRIQDRDDIGAVLNERSKMLLPLTDLLLRQQMLAGAGFQTFRQLVHRLGEPAQLPRVIPELTPDRQIAVVQALGDFQQSLGLSKDERRHKRPTSGQDEHHNQPKIQEAAFPHRLNKGIHIRGRNSDDKI